MSHNEVIIGHLGDVSEWFGVSSNLCGSQCVELMNACGEQRFKFNCHISRDRCQFSSLDWNHFVDAVGLTVGDILVLLRCDAMWMLNYTVFVLPDAVMVRHQCMLNVGVFLAFR